MINKKQHREYLLDAAETLIDYGGLDKLMETLMDWIDLSTDIRVADSLWDEVAVSLCERGYPHGSAESIDQGQAESGTDEDHRSGI